MASNLLPEQIKSAEMFDVSELSKKLDSAISSLNADLEYLFKNLEFVKTMDGLTPEKAKEKFWTAIQPFRLWLIGNAESLLRGFNLDDKLSIAVQKKISATLAWREAKDTGAAVFTPWKTDELFELIADGLEEQENESPVQKSNQSAFVDVANSISLVQQYFSLKITEARTSESDKQEVLRAICNQILNLLEPLRLFMINKSPNLLRALEIDSTFQHKVINHITEALDATDDLKSDAWSLNLSTLLLYYQLAERTTVPN